MPLEFQKAYRLNSRSLDGTPGTKYWQNFSSYDINAEVFPGTWKLKGKQTITYHNNSPDSLDQIVIRQYANHYKKGAVRANEMPLTNLTDGMIITNLKVNSEQVALDKNTAVSNLAHATKQSKEENRITVERSSTFITLELTTPILPNKTTELFMEWETEMPSVYVNKIGAYDKESAYFGYWYPQIAVYDDIDGWDKNEYTGAQECYTDFADYKVKIMVPKGNYIFATGNLENAEEVLNPQELLAYRNIKTSTDKLVVLDGSKNPISKAKTTWVYHAKNVRDFGFGVSNNFKWVANTVQLGKKPIASNIVYDVKDEPYLNDLLTVQEKGLHFLSKDLPGVTYPYSNFTTFIGVPEFDGMEFPMMANNGFSKRQISNNHMTFHELAHTYLPHWVGINEVKYSWMEEGWATFLTIKFGQHLYRGTEFENYELKRTIRSYERSAGQQGETPLFSPSNYMVVRNMHFQQSYRKPAFMYMALESLLGKELFKKCLKEYLSRWANRHPTPYDFMFTFNDVSGQNLNWFWNKWVFGYGYADVAVKTVEEDHLVLENVGGFPVPVVIQLNYANNRIKTLRKSPEIWVSGDKNNKIQIPDVDNLISVKLITDAFPDVDEDNNSVVLEK
ncbi:Peptidase [Croceitalea dokdonensis DOKDO 023]|uniref:Peptidase n=1 Tax=Croceitalea dokdonensis DOKDO 023 TaxID=1300341 RepID=A0A0P7A869_9FLAO|nr:M1 family metallopeptidase [Croceitalea dokdonensis]KPM33088.1 Peptidase [Croceitalea dokdonensis DOKDO 023]